MPVGAGGRPRGRDFGNHGKLFLRALQRAAAECEGDIDTNPISFAFQTNHSVAAGRGKMRPRRYRIPNRRGNTKSLATRSMMRIIGTRARN